MTQDQKKILIVEDEPSMSGILKDRMTLEGYGVNIASDGASGMTIALREHPDLILLDLVMPKMGGMEMMRKVRKDAWGAKVPIIILTNVSADDSIMQGVLEDEPSYYLVKTNVSVDEVMTRVRDLLGQTPAS